MKTTGGTQSKRGKGYMAMPGTNRQVESSRGVRLTPTEVKVLSLIAQGHSSQEAADRMVVSKRTVDFHLANIYQKLQVNNRVQALRAATRLGLIPFEPFFGQGIQD
ncbi:MAG: LuxR C-terminal-related transcriptional regulator [Fimbriimonadaceae bacterium]